MNFLITYRMVTGTGQLEAGSAPMAVDIVADLRRAGASNITVVDEAGRLVSFEPGGSRQRSVGGMAGSTRPAG